ncbi:hypothetical protein [Baaleninema sp.]|uniref:hypothetical protein n=1 Tax=Baaleninema sp. TaxID=3101197 RepID=UPI003D03AF14
MWKQWISVVLVVMASGCASISPSSEGAELDAVSVGCPDSPPQLSGDRVTEVSLQYQRVRQSGTVTHGEAVGYQFEAKSGQRLNYQVSSNLCVWLFSPDNQLVETATLPKDGNYVLQVSAENRRTDFEIEMAIDPFDRSDFPQAECGDAKPTDSAAYPVNFYPVNAPYSSQNLQKAKSLFCRDAYKKYRKDSRDYSVQIASFTSLEKAQTFADIVSSEISGVSVGEPTVVETP